MNRTTVAFILLLVAIMADFGLHMTQPLGEGFYIIPDVTVVLFSLAAFVASFYAYKTYGFKSKQGKAIILLAAGNLFWFLGEFTWMYIEVILAQEVPLVSLADAFWLTGYPLFLAGAYLAWRTFSPNISRERKILISVAAIAIFFVVTAGSIAPTLSDSEMSLLESVVTASYVIFDLVLLIMFMVLIASFFGGKLSRPWMFIAAGIVLSVVADIVYMAGLYESGSIIDVFWDIDYVLTAFGFFYYGESVKSVLARKKTD